MYSFGTFERRRVAGKGRSGNRIRRGSRSISVSHSVIRLPESQQKSCYHAHCLDFYFVVVQYPINQHHLNRPKAPPCISGARPGAEAGVGIGIRIGTGIKTVLFFHFLLLECLYTFGNF